MTESWEIAHLQIYITLIICAFGIPAIIYQNTPDEVQRVINRVPHLKLRALLAIILAVVALTVITLYFIWHPYFSTSTAVPYSKGRTAAILISAAILLTLFCWLISFWTFSRMLVIGFLKHQILKRYRKGRSPQESHVDNLIYIGERGSPGYEKELVLRAIYDIVDFVLNLKTYKGSQLDHLLKNIPKVLIGSHGLIDSDSKLTVEMLSRIIDEYSRHKGNSNADAAGAVVLMKIIGVAAIERRVDSIARRIINKLRFIEEVSLFQPSSQAILNIGVTAVNLRRFPISTSALDGLDTLSTIGGQSEIKIDKCHDLVTLLASLYSSCVGAREHALRFLKRKQLEFTPSLRSCIQATIHKRSESSQFEFLEDLYSLLSSVKRDANENGEHS